MNKESGITIPRSRYIYITADREEAEFLKNVDKK